jgi:hypothetical protein
MTRIKRIDDGLLVLSAMIRACPRHLRSIDTFFAANSSIPYVQLKTVLIYGV